MGHFGPSQTWGGAQYGPVQGGLSELIIIVILEGDKHNMLLQFLKKVILSNL